MINKFIKFKNDYSRKDASFRAMNGPNWSGYGVWIHENEYKSFSNFDFGYEDSNCTAAEMRAISLGIDLAATKDQWYKNEKLRIEVRTDSDASIQLLCSQRTTQKEQCKFYPTLRRDFYNGQDCMSVLYFK